MAKRVRYKKGSSFGGSRSRSLTAFGAGMFILSNLSYGQLFSFINGKKTYYFDWVTDKEAGQIRVRYHDADGKKYYVPLSVAKKTMVRSSNW